MNKIFKDHLLAKHVFVATADRDATFVESFNTLVALGRLFGIKIDKGAELASKEMIKDAESFLKIRVPKPFYQGFPDSVKQLTPDELLVDQLLHYAITYGLNHFGEPGHSVFERNFERVAFSETCEPKVFSIVTVEEARAMIKESVEALLASTRPISFDNMQLIKAFRTAGGEISECRNKDLAIQMIYDERDLYFLKFLRLPDVYNLVDYINFSVYCNRKTNKLNLKNRDRKFISNAIDYLIERSGVQEVECCFEKRKFWVGLLHHLHYKPKSNFGRGFVESIRSASVGNMSVYSSTERCIERGMVFAAAKLLVEKKGNGALLRNLNYYLSRADEGQCVAILNLIEAKNPLVLLQLLYSYQYQSDGLRSFVFTKHGMTTVHNETEEEGAKRLSVLDEDTLRYVRKCLTTKLNDAYAGLIKGSVYVDPEFKRIAVPINESASNGGYGTLPKGSWLPLPKSKVIRAFTYWEKVNDIDLSVQGLMEDGRLMEYSWRTMWHNQSDDICYSGDETSGYKGGSEYFDVDVELFKRNHPKVEYLIFCNNVYSSKNFNECVCRAGYMTRERLSSGEIYEPKTVGTSFTINAPSTYAYLFAIDLRKDRLIWLNTNRAGSCHVAGESGSDFLRRYFGMTDVFNAASLAFAAAEHITETPEDADVIFSDRFEGDDKVVIHSYDVEKLMALANGKELTP